MRLARYSSRAVRAASRRGLTLIEMLVAIAATLVLMTAVVQIVDMLGGGMADNRATIGMMDSLRSVRQKLQGDLAAHTAQALPWQDAEMAGGYLEFIEGQWQDGPQKQGKPSGWPEVGDGNDSDDYRFGDADDIIALTVRSKGQPFVDINNKESYVAEVIWYLKQDKDPNQQQQQTGALYTLYRHVELVLPKGGETTTEGRLGELTKRENRIGVRQRSWRPRAAGGAQGQQLPHELNPEPSDPNQVEIPDNDNMPDLREDIVLRNVLSFDVKVWDPEAPIYAAPSNDRLVMAPSDPGYSASGTAIGYGAYVDLGYAQSLSPASHFSSLPLQSTKNAGAWNSATWDTWPRYYERDGVDQDGVHGADQGYNGFDDPGRNGVTENGVDDPGELETRPPYDHPLRGVRVTIRIYEPGSQQVRQVSVVQHFMPE